MIYLDNNATTRVADRVLQKALPFLTEQYANASSTHGPGIAASDAVKAARKQVGALLNAEPFENNLHSPQAPFGSMVCQRHCGVEDHDRGGNQCCTARRAVCTTPSLART